MPIPDPDLDELNPDNTIPEKEAAAIVAALLAFEKGRKETLVKGASRAYLRGETVAHKRLLTPLVTEEIKDDVYSFLKTYKGQLDDGYTIIQGEKVHWLKNRTEREREQIFKIVSEGITEGKSPAVVKKEFQDYFKMQRYQADRIARTETAYVQARGRDERYKKFGVERVKWLCGPAPCELCSPLEGRVFEWGQLPYSQPVHPRCYSDDTEVYTDRGFQLIKDVKVGDMCLSLNPETLNLEWVKVVKHIYYHYSDDMLHFHSRNFDMLVTPNHSMFVKRRERKGCKKREWEFIEASKVPYESGFYRSSKWIGSTPEYVAAGLKMDPELYCKFMGFWLADGSIVSTPERHGYRISIAQAKDKNPDTYPEIVDICSNFAPHVQELDVGVSFHNKAMHEYLSQFGLAPVKYVPGVIKDMSPKLIRVFLDTFVRCDGFTRKAKPFKGGDFGDEKVYFTSSKRMADDIGELLIKVGKRPSYYLDKTKGKEVQFKNGNYTLNHDAWRISECNGQTSRIGKTGIKVDKIPYNGFVTCVELEKYHTLYVRRNGKCAWSGNCVCDLAPILE